MDKTPLGKTDMSVTRIGFGAAEIGSDQIDQDTAERVLKTALDEGVNVVDTAACYGNSEEKIGKAIADRRDEYFLFTKCGHEAGLDMPEWTPELMEKSVERSLKRLQTDRVDLLQLHTCDRQKLQAGDVVEVGHKMVEQGKARYIGYSGDGDNARFAIKSGLFDTLQTSVNIVDQDGIDNVLPRAEERNMGVIIKRPIANALWVWDDRPESDYFRRYWDLLREMDYPFLRAESRQAVFTALRFSAFTEGVDCVLVGSTNPDHIRSDIRALQEGPLDPATYKEIRLQWQRKMQNRPS
ncbi:MAG: aldo/keto reductase [Phycisphaerae bacterium]